MLCRDQSNKTFLLEFRFHADKEVKKDMCTYVFDIYSIRIAAVDWRICEIFSVRQSNAIHSSRNTVKLFVEKLAKMKISKENANPLKKRF